MHRLMFALLLSPLWAQAPWTILFDGRSTEGWRAPVSPGFPGDAWRVEEGSLRPLGSMKNIDLWSGANYRDFVLEFEFKLDPGANGGIKYLVQQGLALRQRNGSGPFLRASESEAQPGDLYAEATAGIEFQIVDDATDEAKDPTRRTGAMYALVAPTDPPPIGPGVFHRGKIVVKGDQIEHYLNGRKVLQVTLGSAEMKAAFDTCKVGYIRRLWPLSKRETPIAITHHGSAVWYRNVRVRAGP